MADARYRAPPPGCLRLAPLDALTAIYDRRSGITHVVAPPAPELIAALDDWSDAAALLARLARDYDLADADPAALAARLDELVETGLIERR